MNKYAQQECLGPKNWCDLTEDEKIERMRDIIKKFDDVTRRIWVLEEQIRKHSHHDGIVCTPLTNDRPMQIGTCVNPQAEVEGKVYF